MKFGVSYSRISMVLYIIIALFLIGFIWWVTQRPKNEYLVENFKRNNDGDGGKDRGKKRDRMNKIEKAFEEYLESILKYIKANNKSNSTKSVICTVVASEYFHLESLLGCFKTTLADNDFNKSRITSIMREIDSIIANMECSISYSKITTNSKINANLFENLFNNRTNLRCDGVSGDSENDLSFSAKIRDSGTKKCLNVSGTSVILSDNTTDCKKWIDNKKGNIYFKDNDGNRQCLAAASRTVNSIVSVEEWDKDSENQKWDIIGSKIKLRNTTPPLYLKVTTNGATLVSTVGDANIWEDIEETTR